MLRPQQYALEELWSATRGDPDVRIAIIDGPVDVFHSCFQGANLTAADDTNLALPLGGAATSHGTHIASLIFGQGNVSFTGIAPNCSGVFIPVFYDGMHGSVITCNQFELARAIDTAIEHKANIINISAGQPSPSGKAEPELVHAVRKCVDLGILIVAAAGNGGCATLDACNCLHVPGALPAVLAVGAMDKHGKALGYSNCGPPYRKYGVLAPGESIVGAAPGNTTAIRSGTSFACAIVTGVIALLTSVLKNKGHPPDPFVARDAVVLSAKKCENPFDSQCHRQLAGRMNPSGALHLITHEAAKMTQNPDPAEVTLSATPDKIASVSSVEFANDHREARVGDAAQPIATTQSPGGVPAQIDIHSEPCVSPSACGCGGSAVNQLVFAVGQLGYDFGTESRRNSLQNRFEPSSGAGRLLDISSPSNLLRHIFGWSEVVKQGGAAAQSVSHSPHRHDLKSVIWTLLQDNVPIYAIEPHGSFSEDSYVELAKFLMEQSGFDSEKLDSQLRTTELDIDWTKGEAPRAPRTEFVAIPGVIVGQVRLLTGHVVPVIRPDMAGTSEWNVEDLATMIEKTLPNLKGDDARELVRRILDRFSVEIRNPGLTPEDRARNHGSTDVFHIILNVFETVKKRYKLDQVEIDEVFVTKSGQHHGGSFKLYDFNLSLFDPANVQRAKVVVAVTIDVGDIVPSSIGPARVYSGR